jgi:hypothetical protein
MSECTPAFPSGVSFACMMDFIMNIRQRKPVLELVEQGLWISGSIVTTFKAVPSPIGLFMTVTVNDPIDAQIEARLVEMERIFQLADSPVPMGVDWMLILNLILKLIELLPQR